MKPELHVLIAKLEGILLDLKDLVKHADGKVYGDLYRLLLRDDHRFHGLGVD